MTRGTEYAEGAAERSPQLWAARAGVAERAIEARHLRRLWYLPGTRLGLSGWPPTVDDLMFKHWNYWWQAHLLDCLVDAQLRAPDPRRRLVISAFIRGVHVRNLYTWTNDYYDDIAWLGLALERVTRHTGMKTDDPVDAILDQLRSGWTDHGGGGIWWRKGDDFKNVPANGPAAILLHRANRDRSDRQRARSIAEWVETHLVDERTGLLNDGLHVNPDGTIRDIVTAKYTYCQGVFLGACVELAEHDPGGTWAERAERTIDAIATHMAPTGVLPGQGGGDGGLFAGILGRYLADAATRLPHAAAHKAATMVLTSADALWRNRAMAPSGPLFGPEFGQPAVRPDRPRDRANERDLSVQLSGWMVLEAAATLERATMGA